MNVDPEIQEIFDERKSGDDGKSPISFDWNEIQSSSNENGSIQLLNVEESRARPFGLRWNDFKVILDLLKKGYSDARISRMRGHAVSKIVKIREYAQKHVGGIFLCGCGLESNHLGHCRQHGVEEIEYKKRGRPKCFSNTKIKVIDKTKIIYVPKIHIAFQRKLVIKRHIIEKPVVKKVIEKVFVDKHQPLRGTRKDRKEKIISLLNEGFCNREIARKIKSHHALVARIRKEKEAENGKPFLCGCGQPSNHRAFCSVRIKRYAGRQDFLKQGGLNAPAKPRPALSFCEICNKQLHYTSKTKRCAKHPRAKITSAKKWKLTRPDGAEHHVKNLKQFCIDNGLDFNRAYAAASHGMPMIGNGWRIERQ